MKSTPDWLQQHCEVMVDIETLSTAPNAIILSIGACKFNPQTLSSSDALAVDTFYRNICRKDSEHYGLHRDPSTVEWWSQQSQDAQDQLLDDQRPLKDTLLEFMQWVHEEPRAARCWGNSPSFDMVIMNEAYKATAIGSFPIPFWEWRDVRTIKDAAFPNGEVPEFRMGTHHGALDDSLSQARLVQFCYHQLRLVPNTRHPIL